MARNGRYCLSVLAVLALVSWSAYAAIAALSRQFADGTQHTERPILAVLGLLGVAFGCYLAAIAAAVRAREDRRLLGLIVASSVVFRLTLLGSWPIQEVDIYRYLWDGAATTSGVSPFRYSPQQVLAASPDDDLGGDLRRLVELRESSPAMATILRRVHFPELPTIYPPVSQAVFGLSALITPNDAGVLWRLVILKTGFVLFDLATLMLVIGLLRLVGQQVGWSVAYGWCPLLMKEFANSGHLDAVAVFLTTLSVFITLRVLFPGGTASLAAGGTASLAAGGTASLAAGGTASLAATRKTLWASAAASLLGLAVGAKLYGILLGPWFAAAWIRGLGWRRAIVPATVFAAAVVGVLYPMTPPKNDPPPDADRPVEEEAVTNAEDLEVISLPPPEAAATQPQDPSLGLRTFLRRWEINDFLFLLLVENLKPHRGTPVEERPWFAVVPEAWRIRLLEAPAAWLQVDLSSAAGLLGRLLSGGVFVVLALGLARHAVRSADRTVWLETAMLTLAWFWLLCPTQNPWYWTWVLPLVMFARSRAWLALSGLTLIYYLRFWLAYHWPEQPVWGTGYRGELFFDFVVTWLEFGPWFAWLAIDGWCRRRRTKCARSHRPSQASG